MDKIFSKHNLLTMIDLYLIPSIKDHYYVRFNSKKNQTKIIIKGLVSL
jgi:hypothetical protein